jgi:hypothetical protein
LILAIAARISLSRSWSLLIERSRPGTPIPVSKGFTQPSLAISNLSAQQVLEFQLESGLVEKAGSLLPRYEQIDVAIWASFAARHRPD